MVRVFQGGPSQRGEDAFYYINAEELQQLSEKIERQLCRHPEEEAPIALTQEDEQSCEKILLAIQSILDSEKVQDVDDKIVYEGLRKLTDLLKKLEKRKPDKSPHGDERSNHLNSSRFSFWQRLKPFFQISVVTSSDVSAFDSDNVRAPKRSLKLPDKDLWHLIKLSPTPENPSDEILSRISYAFREPKIISPGPTFAYQFAHSYISPLHRERFPAVVNIFKMAIEKSPRLFASRDWMCGIVYHLAMCGVNMQDAETSIVATCPKGSGREAKSVSAALSQKHVLAQYAFGHTEVAYRLYIWQGAFEYLGGTADHAEIHFDKESSLCGAAVTHQGGSRLSNVACVLKVQDKFYALTSAHPFENQPEPSFISSKITDHQTKDSNNSDSMGNLIRTCGNGASTSRGYTKLASRSPTFDHRLSDCTVVRPPNEPSWTGQRSNLDWSLLRLNCSVEPNSFYPTQRRLTEAPHHIDAEPALKPARQRPVYILLANCSSSKGVISTAPALMSSSNGYGKLCEVWTVLITQGRSLKTGDSGSLVVDQATNQAYGHVIATNPLGGVFVVPLAHTLEQIQAAFGSSEVKLYSRSRTTPSSEVKLYSRPRTTPSTVEKDHDENLQHNIGLWQSIRNYILTGKSSGNKVETYAIQAKQSASQERVHQSGVSENSVWGRTGLESYTQRVKGARH